MFFFFGRYIFVLIIDISFGKFTLILVTIVRRVFLLNIISLLTFLLTMLILANLVFSFPIAKVISITKPLNIIHIIFGPLPDFVIACSLIFSTVFTFNVMVTTMQLTHKIIHEFFSILLFFRFPVASFRGSRYLTIGLCFSYFWLLNYFYSLISILFCLLFLSCTFIWRNVFFCFFRSRFNLHFL